jgi:hypothetical protein
MYLLCVLIYPQCHYFMMWVSSEYGGGGFFVTRNSDIFFQWLFQPIQGPGLLFSSVILFTDGRTPWASDQLVARPLPKHGTTQTQNNTHTQNIHVLNEIRTHDLSVRANEDSLCFRPRGYYDRQLWYITKQKIY